MPGVTYEPVNDAALTQKAYEFQLQGKLEALLEGVNGGAPKMHVRGECPRCGGSFSSTRPIEVYAMSFAPPVIIEEVPELAKHPDDRFSAQTVLCAVEGVEGAPANLPGCGAAFSVWALVK